MELYEKHFGKPKNHMQVLEEDQLNLLFDVFTKSHQVASLEEALKATGEAKAPAKTAEKQENKPAEAPKAPAAKKENKPAAPQSEQKKEEPKKDERRRERRVVDTSAVTVNAERFDDRVDSLVSERMQNAKGGKQRIGGKQGSNNKKKGNFGNKRRNEEQEKMRRLQLEIAKKTPLTVKIPDEITVGELASRMKKTAAEVIKQLIKLGVMAAVNQVIDYDTAALVAMELGCKVEKEVVVTIA